MENSTKKSVLITGSNGFIGYEILKRLLQTNKFEITALVHNNISEKLKTLNNINIIKSDVTDENKIKNIEQFDIVIHAAGLARDIGKDENFRKLNFESVKNISKLVKEKFIYVSSTDVYGIKDFNNADENTPFCNYPNNPYPKYKIKSEEWITKNFDKKYVIIRPAAVWGENDKTIEKRVVDFLKTSPFIIHFGKWKGKNRWPLADVKNVSKTVLAACLFDEFDFMAINVIDSKKTTIDDYYKNIAQKYFPDKKFKTLFLPMWIGKIIGLISTNLSNLLNCKDAIFDPTYYSLHHVASNLDFDNKRMEKAINLLQSCE